MARPTVTVIDYGIGNILSVQRSLEHVGGNVVLSSDAEQILNASKLVLPGVGAFSHAMERLRNLGLISAIQAYADQGRPLLGICLGMQLLMDESEEYGTTSGLGVLPGRVVSIPDETWSGIRLKNPHIGWNALLPSNKSASWSGSVLANTDLDESFYFVHSFMSMPAQSSDCLAHCVYGDHAIPAVVRRGAITGCQFHPEKSGEAGLRILATFIE